MKSRASARTSRKSRGLQVTVSRSDSIRSNPGGDDCDSDTGCPATIGGIRTRSDSIHAESGGDAPDGSYDRLQAELTASISARSVKETVPFVQSNVFTSFVCTMVLLNTAQMGFEADFPSWWGWDITEQIFTAVFFVEMVMKIASMRLAYFHDKWNWLDCFLAILAATDTWFLAAVTGSSVNVDLQSLSILRIMRMARLVRVLRLVKQFKRFVLIIAGVVDAIRTTCWVACVLGMAIYVCAIFCVDYLGRSNTHLYPGATEDPDAIDALDVMENFNPYLSFGSMGKAMLTLFNIAILAEWSEVIRPIAVKQPWMVLFFIMFVLFVTFGVMNVIIGMIVDNVMNNAQKMQMMNEQKEHERRWAIFEEIKTLVWEMDRDLSDHITMDELSKNMAQGRLQSLLMQVNLPQGCTAEELYNCLDENGDGFLKCSEFIQSFYRLIQNDDFQRNCMFQMGIHHVKRLIREKDRERASQIEALTDVCQELKLALVGCRPELSTDNSAIGDYREPAEKTSASSSTQVQQKASHRLLDRPSLQDHPPLPAAKAAASGEDSPSAEEAVVLPPAVSAGPPKPDAGYCAAFVGYDSAPSWNVPSTSLAENGTDAGLEKVAASSSRSPPPEGRRSAWSSEAGADSPSAVHKSVAVGKPGPSGTTCKRTYLKMQVHHAIQVARQPQPRDAACVAPESVRLESYREFAGCLDAVCAEVQDAVWCTVREIFSEYLAAAERALGEAHEHHASRGATAADGVFVAIDDPGPSAKGSATSVGL